MIPWIVGISIFLVVFVILPLSIREPLMDRLYRYFFGRMNEEEVKKWDLGDKQYERHKDRIKSSAEELESKPHEGMEIKSNDGLGLYADYFEHGSDTTVILVHGIHTFPMYNFSITGLALYEKGYNLLIINQRAHLKSEGEWLALGVKESEDLSLWISHIKENTNTKKIILYGVSNGATTIEFYSDKADPAVKCAICDSGFESFDSLERHIMKTKGIPYFLSKNAFFKRAMKNTGIDFRIESTIPHLQKSKMPIFFIHGENDEVVSTEDSIKNYNACTTDKKLKIIKNAGHTTAIMESFDETMPEIIEFIEKYKI